MIHTDLFHFTWESSKNIIRSHKLEPSEWVTLFCIITWDKENVVSILEDHLLESISGMEWMDESINTDFTYISENFNHFIQNIDESDRIGTGVILAVLIENQLIFSHIGDTSILLVEEDGTITSLNNNNPEKTEFEAISTGEILAGAHIYLSSSSLEERLSDDLLRDLSLLTSAEWRNIVHDVLRKELQESVHIAHIQNEKEQKKNTIPRGRKQIDILRASGEQVLSKLDIQRKTRALQDIADGFFMSKKQEVKITFLIMGIVLLFWLIYLLFSAISGVVSSPERDAKNELIKAQELVEQSQQLASDPAWFNKTVEQAEAILFSLREKRVYMTDTQELLSRIEAMKKEVNDIQVIDMSKLTNIIKTADLSIEPVGIFEYNKKLNIIGKKWAILDYARGEWLPTVKSYPTGEEARWFDVADDGTYFIITEQNKVLTKRWNELTYITNNGKNDWINSPVIKTFNGNVYLIGSTGKTVERYRPGINGFSTPTSLITTENPILDIGIDGGIYVLSSDGKIIRYIGGTTGGQKNLTINKVPGEYTLWTEERTQIHTKANLSYVYVLSGKNIWIFAPDSKRFQDVTAWNYVAQLELQTTEEVKNIHIPRDWTIYIATSLWIYELGFEIADGKIILR